MAHSIHAFTSPRILVIGVGNAYRSDDGVGLFVVRQIDVRNLPNVTVSQASGEGAALIETWRGADTVILIDAVESGAPTGAIHRFDANAERIPSKFFHYSTHAFSVAEAIELARVLNQLPQRLIVYGIEGKTFEAGIDLSVQVVQAAHVVAKKVARDILVLTNTPAPERAE